MGDHTQAPIGVSDELLAAVAAAGPKSTLPPDVRMPFPMVALPAVLRQFVQDTADALGVTPECVATPAIATCATAIGNTYRIRVQPSHTEPSVIWAVTLMESDSSEMPAYQAAMAPLVAEQASREEWYEDAMIRYPEEKQRWKDDLAKWKARAGWLTRHAAPEEPKEPREIAVLTSEWTVQGLATRLAKNPRGLALKQDDLSGFFKRSAFKGGRRDDEATFLEFYNAGTVTLHRSNGKRIFVPTAVLSIVGTCPPEAFRKAIGADGSSRSPVKNRLAARFILASPESKPQTSRESKPYDTGPYHQMIRDLLDIYLPSDTEPIIVPMLPEAQEQFNTFITEHEPQTAAIGNPTLRSHHANLEAVAARLALIFYLCDWETQQLVGISNWESVQARHVQAGIALARWYGQEATRVYDGDKGAAEREQRELLQAIRKHGGEIRPWEMRRLRVQWANTEVAEKALRAMERAGFGELTTEPGPKGGRPAFRFKLHPQYRAQTPENPDVSGGSQTLEDPDVSGVCVDAGIMTPGGWGWGVMDATGGLYLTNQAGPPEVGWDGVSRFAFPEVLGSKREPRSPPLAHPIL